MMFCQSCGIEAPTRKVAFYQNIGLIAVRYHQGIEGKLCKSCIHKNFWKMTATTLFLGWWGAISLIVTPFFLLNNIIRYLIVLPMPAVPPGASVPMLTDKDRERIAPHLAAIIADLNSDATNFQEVAEEFANRIGVTPGQIWLAIHEVTEETESEDD